MVCGNIFTALSHPYGHLNRITGSRVTAFFLNGWILLIGGASAVEGLLSTGPTQTSVGASLAWAVLTPYPAARGKSV